MISNHMTLNAGSETWGNFMWGSYLGSLLPLIAPL
jgi:hypothetical protein